MAAPRLSADASMFASRWIDGRSFDPILCSGLQSGDSGLPYRTNCWGNAPEQTDRDGHAEAFGRQVQPLLHCSGY